MYKLLLMSCGQRKEYDDKSASLRAGSQSVSYWSLLSASLLASLVTSSPSTPRLPLPRASRSDVARVTMVMEYMISADDTRESPARMRRPVRLTSGVVFGLELLVRLTFCRF